MFHLPLKAQTNGEDVVGRFQNFSVKKRDIGQAWEYCWTTFLTRLNAQTGTFLATDHRQYMRLFYPGEMVESRLSHVRSRLLMVSNFQNSATCTEPPERTETGIAII